MNGKSFIQDFQTEYGQGVFFFHLCALVTCCSCTLTLLEAPRCCQCPCRNSKLSTKCLSQLTTKYTGPSIIYAVHWAGEQEGTNIGENKG